jgi:hypothetical protein
MSIRNKIWYGLNDSKTNEILASLTVKKYQKWDLFTNICLLSISFSSIATWAIWKEMSILWAIIIGLSQIFTLGKPYFLFSKYIRVFSEKSILWQQYSLDLEKLWHKINNGQIEDSEASNIFFDLKQKSLSFDQIPEDIIFFDFNKLQLKAEKQCDYYTRKLS